MTNPYLFDSYRDRQAIAAKLRGDFRFNPQDIVLIPGMTAAAEPCTLARHWSELLHPENALAQIKMNGVRALALTGRIVSREAVPLDCALHCRKALREVEEAFGEPMVFDSEYVEAGGLHATLSAMRRGEGAGVMFLFDAVPYREWKENRFTVPLHERLAQLRKAVEAVQSPFVDFLHAEKVSAEQVPHLARVAYENRMEGLVVKDADSVYVRGRSPTWLKVKNKITREARIVDMVVEDGRAKTLICKMLEDGRTVRVGSDIPEGLRARMGIDPESFSGAVLELGATDTNDRGTLTGVHFITMRPDRR